MGWMGRTSWIGFVLAFGLARPADPAHPPPPVPQASFDQAIRDLSSADPSVRFHSLQALKEAAYPEAAVPIAPLIADPRDDVQFEAIAAELNIFLAERIVSRKRVGLVVEVRNAVTAEPLFSSGPLVIGARPVPAAVLTALRTASRDDNRRVGLEALYAFGVLAVEPGGAARRELLGATGPDVAALIGAVDPSLRYAAIRVLGRVFARRADDPPIETTVGDAIVGALNDRDEVVKGAAMRALGELRYDRALQALTELFQYYAKGPLAEAALDALARIAHPGSAVLFDMVLSSKTPSLKGIAAEGLARLGDAQQLPAIEMALRAERNEATILTGRFAAAMLARGSIDAIAEALARPKLRDQAKQYLIELAPGRTSLFAPLLRDPMPLLRADALDAIALGGDPSAIGAVEPLTRDPDPLVARAAERAVARLRQSASR
jgi:HEAT repeat protein